MNEVFVLIYFFFFALITGAAFAFMWRSMDLMFKQLDKPIRQIHPEMRDIKPDDELLVFKCAATRTCDAWLHGGPIRD